jgi:hypothetical protein
MAELQDTASPENLQQSGGPLVFNLGKPLVMIDIPAITLA